MATHVLSTNTLISTLLPSGGGTLDSGDSIDLAGHDIIIDTNALSYPVTLVNSGTTSHMEMRDGGGIKLNNGLPTSICTWVDTNHPLPAYDESKAIDGDPYRTNLTANARAEIQLALPYNTSLGGGPMSLPTATRQGNWWGMAARFLAGNIVQLDRDLNIHVGDLLFSYKNGAAGKRVTAYDANTRSVTLDGEFFNRSTPQVMVVVGGGVVINSTSGDDGRKWFTAPIEFGTLNVFATGGAIAKAFNCALSGKRLFFGGTTYDGVYNNERGMAFRCIADVDECATATIFASNMSSNSDQCAFRGRFGTLIANRYLIGVQSSPFELIAESAPNPDGAFWSESTQDGIVRIGNYAGSRSLSFHQDSTLQVTFGDTTILRSGTVTRVARTAFPTDTDLPDAFYFVPATTSDVPWRYEDYWVRKGETLRLSCRAMRGGDNGTARVAIGEMGVWVPTAGMSSVLAEWTLDSGAPLVWRGEQIQWTNNTGEDRQVRVWSMGSGLNGAYIRVWRATGGAM